MVNYYLQNPIFPALELEGEEVSAYREELTAIEKRLDAIEKSGAKLKPEDFADHEPLRDT